jgi:hypothetical protein
MRSAVTVESDSATGEHFQLTLEKAANDQGTIRIRSWRSDQHHHIEGPDKDNLVQLYEIRSSEDGSRIVCKGDVFGPDPVVSCTIQDAEPPRPALVRVAINGTLGGLSDGTTEYMIGQVEHDRIKQFVLCAGFPSLP